MRNLRWTLFGAATLSSLAFAADGPQMNGADTAWMLISTALVLLMTPGLAFFYGGMVRSKNSLNTMMMSFAALGFVGIAWALIGYSLALSPGGSKFIGDLSLAFLHNVGLENKGSVVDSILTIPHLLYMGFQMTFCIITAALISGSIIDRMRFPAYLLFITLWSLTVYAIMAKMVWGGGFLAQLGAWDFAGGTVVHINAGIAGLVAALVLGPRKDFGRQAYLPHNVPFILLGTALLWFGWFGFNGGSALAANGIGALAFINTMLAPMATMVVWGLLDLIRTGRITAIGAATGVVVGLVAITPAAGFISAGYAIVLGAIAAFPSYFVLLWRAKSKLDDSLDVFAGHGIGGITGAILTGVFAQKAINGVFDGWAGGNFNQVLIQALAAGTAVLVSGVGTFLLLKLVNLITPIKASPKEEGLGMDVTQHGEEAYSSGEGAILVNTEAAAPVAKPKPVGGTD